MDWEKARIKGIARERGTVFVGVLPAKRKKVKKKRKPQADRARSAVAREPQHIRDVRRKQDRLQRLTRDYLVYVRETLSRGARPTSIPQELRREIQAAGGPERWALSQAGNI